MREDAPTRRKLQAVIVHWGDVGNAVRLAALLDRSVLIDRVVVVANDLKARPVGLVRDADWITPPRNLGYAGAFDYAVRNSSSTSDFILLNADVWFDEAALVSCMNALSDSQVGIAAPLTFNDHGFQAGVGSTSAVLCRNAMHAPASSDVVDAEWVTGAIMFIKGECYESARFDLSYFLYWEDTDLCFRARRAGWRVVAVGNARAWHRGGSTVPRLASYYYTARNRLWFARRWCTPWRVMLLRIHMIAVLFPRTFLADVLKRRSVSRAVMFFRGVLAGLARPPAGDVVPIGEPRASDWTEWR